MDKLQVGLWRLQPKRSGEEDMESKVKILGHPIHQMLVPLPFGLLAMAAIFDVIYLVLSNPAMLIVSYWMIAAGIVGGLVAAPFGLIDYLAIPSGTRAKSVGMVHGIGNVFVLLFFTSSWLLRHDSPDPSNPNVHYPSVVAFILSFAGFAVAGVTGWLGGELVSRLRVGVDEGAHVDASSSLLGHVANRPSR
jgi:uncharacterized membrane protein